MFVFTGANLGRLRAHITRSDRRVAYHSSPRSTRTPLASIHPMSSAEARSGRSMSETVPALALRTKSLHGPPQQPTRDTRLVGHQLCGEAIAWADVGSTGSR